MSTPYTKESGAVVDMDALMALSEQLEANEPTRRPAVLCEIRAAF